MKKILSCSLLPILGFAALLLISKLAWADSISPICEPDTCTWEISVEGELLMSGSYSSDPDTGELSFEGASFEGSDFTVSLDSISGNIDPVLGFGLGATNSSGGLLTYAFAFSMPLGGLSPPISTYAELGTTLSAFTSAGGSVFPTLGGGLIVDSQDITISPFASVDKGVDIGDGTTTGSMGTVFDFDSASGSILAGGPYDLMSVVVAFGLTDQTGVGMSGFVEQTAVVPVPAAVWLFGSGLLGLIAIARRKD